MQITDAPPALLCSAALTPQAQPCLRLAWAGSIALHAAVLLAASGWYVASSPPPAAAALAVELADLPHAPEPTPAPAEPPPTPSPVARPPPSRSKPTPAPPPRLEPVTPQALDPPPELPTLSPAPSTPPQNSTQPREAEIATVPSAPVLGSHGVPDRNAVVTWESRVLAAIETHKRYPSSARAARQEDTVSLRLRIGKDGSVDDATVVASQGYAALDDEVLKVVRRIGHLPAPPSDLLSGGEVVLIIPIRFSLRVR